MEDSNRSGNASLHELEPYFEYAYKPARYGGEQVQMGFSLSF